MKAKAKKKPAARGGAVRSAARTAGRYRLVVGYVGEDGIKPNTKYRATTDGKLYEVAS